MAAKKNEPSTFKERCDAYDAQYNAAIKRSAELLAEMEARTTRLIGIMQDLRADREGRSAVPHPHLRVVKGGNDV